MNLTAQVPGARQADRPVAAFKRRAGALRVLAITAAALAALLPLLPIFLWSIAGRWRFPALWPQVLSLRGFQHLAEPGARVLAATLNSLGIAAAVMVAAVVIGLPAGKAIGSYRFRGKGLVIFLILLPVLVPPLTATLGIDLTFIRLGLADTVYGVFLVHLIPTVPYTTLILASVFSARSDQTEAVARTLGAGPLQAFFHVTLPQIAPGVAVAALFAFLISWSQYILTLVIGGGNVLTLPLLLFSAASGSDPVITAVLALVFLAPLLPVLIAALSYLRAGDGVNPLAGGVL